jgi:hypothetical protein
MRALQTLELVTAWRTGSVLKRFNFLKKLKRLFEKKKNERCLNMTR